jgi:RimJ/RimL family protein N-acetyltransferase
VKAPRNLLPSGRRGCQATLALRGGLLGQVLADPRVHRVMAETLVELTASRRVMEKAGMGYCGRRVGEVDGTTAELVVYQALPSRP